LALVPLNGFEVFAEVLDALPDSRFVVMFEVLEDGSPYGHRRRAMQGEAEAEAKNVRDIFFRELSAMLLRES
jgi:hypothetical protein